ncbi:uncharacterized protein LOC133824273 [Humulus lupulus]|uniref:uncharacterized protein LOC133824273 n=1 Tax=Humulus lupulus TaxID=3486 RepID=UPI002B40C7DB|nr:uncharacterized protein LOC133824273 [Humulus lupulus]
MADETKETEPKINETEIKDLSSNPSTLKPWEQHGGVINLPRFDYNAPSSLLQYSHTGFLITCTIKREKSATKEAMSILGKYFTGSSNENSNISDEASNSKKRKTCTEDLDNECNNDEESKEAANFSENKSGSSVLSTKNDTIEERNHVLSLVKLTGSGLLLFTFTKGTSFDPVQIVSNIIESRDSASSSSPQWCHRIFPIQATCSLNEKELHTLVSKLVLDFVNDKQKKLAKPLKFAVGYNRRGTEEAEMKVPKDTSTVSTGCNLLDRNNCFSIVAAAVKEVVPDSVVDLRSPELSVLVELLPLSRVRNGSLVVAVSVLPQNLVSTKPRLCIKALVSNVKVKGAKH